MSAPVVELRDVFCVHRTNEGDAAALQGMSLELAPREILCVLGPSGSGKSTLLRVLAGLQTPSAGRVGVLGRDMGRLAPRARARLRHRCLGLLTQEGELGPSPDLPVRSSVALPLALRGAPRREQDRRVAGLLEAAGLVELAQARPRELSGGERQRFAVCAALAHRPGLLLADEPTGGLDVASAAAVRELITSLARADGAGVIIASHDGEAAGAADRVVRIRDGRVVEERVRGETALVLGRGGWIQLPARALSDAGVGPRALASAVDGGVLVRPARQEARRPGAAPRRSAPEPAWSSAEIELREVVRRYRQGRSERVVVDGFTRAFAAGELTVVAGRSGAGKTTLLRLLCGLDVPDRGQVLLDGHDLARDGAEDRATHRRRRIGYVSQDPLPVGFLSAVENVVLVLRARGWAADRAVRRALDMLERVGLAERAEQRAERLSAGEAQRLALARGLASARGLLVVDEPTSRLDEANAAAAGRLLADAAREDGQTVVCATHDPQVTARADAVVRLDELAGAAEPAAGRPA